MGSIYELPPEWSVYGALEGRDTLMAWVAEHSGKSQEPLTLSAEKVTHVDGAGLQLLAALENQDVAWTLVKASEAFIEACTALGFHHWTDALLQTKKAGV